MLIRCTDNVVLLSLSSIPVYGHYLNSATTACSSSTVPYLRNRFCLDRGGQGRKSRSDFIDEMVKACMTNLCQSVIF